MPQAQNNSRSSWLPVVGGALDAIGGLFSNIGSAKQAQLNREFQERMLDKQMDFATDMWQKNAEYNSASQQRKRLEDAGLNPYLMMSGGSAGSATSVSPAGAPSGATASFTPVQGFGSATASAANLLQQRSLVQSQQRKTNAEATVLEADARSRERSNEADIILRSAEAGLITKQTARQAIENTYLPHQMAANVAGTQANTKKLLAEEKFILANEYAQQVQNKNLPQRIRMELFSMASGIELNSQNIKESMRRMETMVWSMKPEFEKITGRKMSDREAKELLNDMLSYKSYEVQELGNRASYRDPYQYLQEHTSGRANKALHFFEYARRFIPFVK